MSIDTDYANEIKQISIIVIFCSNFNLKLILNHDTATFILACYKIVIGVFCMNHCHELHDRQIPWCHVCGRACLNWLVFFFSNFPKKGIDCPPDFRKSGFCVFSMLGDVIKTTACVIGAGCAAVVAVHPVLGAIGFTVGGIAPGSIAATSMSIAAYWSGGGVTSGSLVALCQSIGRCRECVGYYIGLVYAVLGIMKICYARDLW